MNRKDERKLAEKYHKLKDLSGKRSVLKLDGNRFREFARNSPRNYSLIIMFTALRTGRNCKICQEVSDEYQVVADSFRLGSTKAEREALFFGMADYDGAPDAFQIMKLEQAPVFIHFPDKGKPQRVDTMDISNAGFRAEAIAKFVNDRTGVRIRITRPPNYKGFGAFGLVAFLIACILYLRRDNLEFLYNTKAWGIIIVGFVVIMMSGQTWNSIRGPPVAQKSSSGVAFIHENAQFQYIAESYIILFLYGGIVVGMIMVTDANVKKGHVSKRRMFAIIGIALIAVFYSFILSIFRSKADGYPFSFLLR